MTTALKNLITDLQGNMEVIGLFLEKLWIMILMN